MAYNNFLQSLNNNNNQELEIESLVNQDKTIYHQKIEENIAKFGDLALGLHGTAEMMKGLRGVYGKYKEKVLKKLTNTSDDDLENIGISSEKIKPFQKWNEMKEIGGRQIKAEDISRVRSGESFRSVMPDYGETSLDTPALPQVVREAPTDITPVEATPIVDADPYGMATLAERIEKQRRLFPEQFKPQFSEPTAPRGFGQEIEEPKPQLLKWDEPSVRRLTTVQEARPIEPAVLRGKPQVKELTMEERREAGKRYKQIVEKRRAEEPDFKYHGPTQGEHEYQRGLKTELSDKYAQQYDLPPIPEPPKLELPEIKDLPGGEEVAPRGQPIVIEEAEPSSFQPQGFKISQVLREQKRKMRKAIRKQKQEPEPEPERPLTPSQEIQPVREDPIAEVREPVAEPVAEAVRPPIEDVRPTVAEGFTEMKETPSVAKTVAKSAGEALSEDATEDIAFSALDAIPVLGEIAGLGAGIYSLFEAFKPHHEPKETIVPTGVAYNPEGEMGASGYV